MKIGIGSDHAGFYLKSVLKTFLEKMGHQVRDFGTDSDESVDYPRFIRPVADAVQKGDVVRGIVLGGSGNGEAMAANRVPGIRCALCWNVESARLARAHNDANMLSLGARLITEKDALDMVRIWIETPFEAGRHLRRIKQIDAGRSDGRIDAQPQKPKAEAPPGTEASWDILIAFRYIVYIEGDNRIEFQIDPGLKSPSTIHFPSRERWDTELPAWARGRRDEIMERVRSKCGHLTYEMNEY
ncbi:MAG: ribose 5-phosphate isomerase B [Deltaproteobacteria bacterium]|nr:ribose 5-phosphate isomerase B [Deltaproteobacteria bacterium]